MNKNIFLPLALFFTASFASAQQEPVELIKETITEPQVEFHIRFLASDELQGRDVGSPGIQIAARYIADYFISHNVRPLESLGSYFQEVPLEKTTAHQDGTLRLGKHEYTLANDFLPLAGENAQLSGPVVYLNYGTEEELEKAKVEGKIVLLKAGLPGEDSPQAWFSAARQKRQLLTEKGAKALIELYNHPQLEWSRLQRYLGGEEMGLAERGAEGTTIPHLWLLDVDNQKLEQLSKSKKLNGQIELSGKEVSSIPAHNVLGFIEGTNPELKDEYLLLAAHFDHEGTTSGAAGADTIYNGARDNAVGVAAVLMAAKYFNLYPPERSIIFAAWTAEEKGLLGSAWYAQHPAVPLEQTVFNLNIDGAGYNDTTKVTIIGLGRTTADEALKTAVNAFGLEAIPDPVPQQNLFDRSDNVNFARKGIPAPTFSPGFTAFDAEVLKYYHQVIDNPETLDFDYLTNYCRAYTLAVQKIAAAAEAPYWIEGDKYEEAAEILYSE
ncbi:M28 family peptidase [Nafulsella turpanensis]|uniref:M28 family peptidase n=1 Tax=Nafulsella turpanensis TaxID=1265690 RepID=UPI000344BEDC|nr:M28 family peptidase [Nafulsella turpanensis]